jgi:D-beta-D-heptose 7-phosphate kinase / D-beta-D-heptose 1-phosphate adenosyltransferase
MVSRNSDLINSSNAFASQNVLVLGEAMLDSYLRGTSERLCQEAPVPIVDIHETTNLAGGAANTAANLSSLGAHVTFLSVIGDDEPGSRLLQTLEQDHIATEHVVRTPNRNTLSKQRISAGSQIVVRFDQGSTHPLDTETEAELIKRLELLYQSSEAIVISDYNHGLMTPRVLQALARLQQEDPRVMVVDSKQPKAYRHVEVTAVKLNYEESIGLLGMPKVHGDEDRLEQVQQHGRKVLDLTRAQIAAITLDRSGALIFHRGDEMPYRTYADPQPDSQAAGAGDTFVSALALSLTAGAPIEHAAEIASAAASIVVVKSGTSVCSLEELKEFFSTDEKVIHDVFQLALRVALYRRTGRRIVFTNGCFDILHRGHITYLNRAKALGDILIVGLNSDRSVRNLKGPTRPINALEDRAQVLAALSCVDHIVPFDSSTPHDLIRRIKPDVFVKGGDYTRETLPEASLVDELGGQVEILPYLESYSTTRVIEKIHHPSTGDERPGHRKNKSL